MRDALLALGDHPIFRRLSPWVGYFLASVVFTWPLVLHLDQALMGYPSIDSQDTLSLRGLVAELLLNPGDWPQSQDVYFPIGYPILLLTPNLLDHLTAAPLVWLLPFPLADNLWWLFILTLNGWAAHRLGRRVGESEGAAWLCGLAFLVSEPLLREANLSHAPQSMLFWAPLYLEAVLDLRDDRGSAKRAAIRAGIFLALAGLSYWYLAFFLVLSSLPLLWGIPLRNLSWTGGISAVLTAPFLLHQLVGWNSRPLTSRDIELAPASDVPESFSVIDEAHVFVTQHGSEPLWFLGGAPIDMSSQVSLVLLVAAGLGVRSSPHRWRLLGMAAVGATMVLGPYLRWGEDVVTIGGHPILLPFGWLMELSPVFERLTWPERWGIILPLALLPLAARAPRPWLWIPLLLIEAPIRSDNLPLQHSRLDTQLCWRELTDAPGAILELPAWKLRRYQRASQTGLHQRLHGRPLVNELALPPGATPPEEWMRFTTDQPALLALRDFEAGKFPAFETQDIRALREAGISAIVVDAEPGGVLATPGALNRFRVLDLGSTQNGVTKLPDRSLSDQLGTPIDLGCALVWWLEPDVEPPTPVEDGDAWREEAALWMRENPAPVLNTLIEPTWNRLRVDQASSSTR
jgi:hypothetical protein